MLFSHCYEVYPESLRFHVRLADGAAWLEPWAWFRYTPLHVLVSGEAAVMFFFVLSGFVLALPFVERTQPPYGRYLVKRFCRLYLPFAAAILISATLYLVIAPEPIAVLGRVFNAQSWSHPIAAKDVLRHLAMTGMARDEVLDIPMWSLVHEVRISIIFPLLVSLTGFGIGGALGLALLIYGSCSFLLLHIGAQTVPGTLLASAQFIVFFVAGIALASRRAAWSAALRAASRRDRILLWLVSLAALLCPASAGPVSRISWGIGGIGFLTLSTTSAAAERVLSLPPLQWLGRVSYSLYLVHVLVLLTAVHLLYGRIPVPAILAATVVLSLIAAELMFRLVERPSLRLGRLLARGRAPPVAARLAGLAQPAAISTGARSSNPAPGAPSA